MTDSVLALDAPSVTELPPTKRLPPKYALLATCRVPGADVAMPTPRPPAT